MSPGSSARIEEKNNPLNKKNVEILFFNMMTAPEKLNKKLYQKIESVKQKSKI